MIKNKKKNQKPIEYDIHLKYLCSGCGQSHWLSFKEASTPNYKIVCGCDNVFKVKRVIDFKLKYHSSLPKNKESPSVVTEKVSNNVLPVDLLASAVKSLVGLGFTNSEAKSLVTKTYNESPTDDIGSLVKKTLESLKNVK
jgi:hypothetical protein